MSKANIRKWVKALRSGRYPQTRLTLRDSNGYCCLGVAIEESGQVGELGEDNLYRYLNRESAGGLYGFSIQTLTWDCQEWLGVAHANPRIEFPEPIHVQNTDSREFLVSLAQLNDEGLTFDQIADIIVWAWLPGERVDS